MEQYCFSEGVPGCDATALKKVKFVEDVEDGDSFIEVFIVDEISSKEKKKGGKYWNVVLRDRTGTITSRIWDESAFTEGGNVRRGAVVKVQADASVYKGEMQLTIRKIRLLDQTRESFAIEDFVPVGPNNRFYQMDCLREMIYRIYHPGLQAVCMTVLDDPRMHMALRDCPAAKGMHHAYVGGLVDHVLSMMRISISLCEHYKYDFIGLLLAACLFHDIGKTRELEWELGIKYSREGNLVGHVAIGLEMLDCLRGIYWKAVEDAGLKSLEDLDKQKELWDHLRHLVGSHHGKTEWGAVQKPQSREAMLFHLVDMIDSRMAAFDNALKDQDPDAEGFSDRAMVTEGRMWRSIYDWCPKLPGVPVEGPEAHAGDLP